LKTVNPQRQHLAASLGSFDLPFQQLLTLTGGLQIAMAPDAGNGQEQ
jgi:hypothetical protein